jgi:hypothetical protein
MVWRTNVNHASSLRLTDKRLHFDRVILPASSFDYLSEKNDAASGCLLLKFGLTRKLFHEKTVVFLLPDAFLKNIYIIAI